MDSYSIDVSRVFDSMPQPVLLEAEGVVCYANLAAHEVFDLRGGDPPLPAQLLHFSCEEDAAGSMSLSEEEWYVTARWVGDCRLYTLERIPEAPVIPNERVERLTAGLRQAMMPISRGLDGLLTAESEPTREERRRCLALIDKGYYQLLRTVTNLELYRTLSQGLVPPLQVIEASEFLRLFARRVGELCDDCGFTMTLYGDETHAMVMGNEQLLNILLLNLLSNSWQASAPGSEFVLNLSASQTEVRITLTDQGSGIPAAIMPRLFLPELSPMEDGAEHYGLGIPLCQLIAQAHGGKLMVLNGAEGVRTILTLPRRLPESFGAMGSPVSELDYAGGGDMDLIQLSGQLGWELFERYDGEERDF